MTIARQRANGYSDYHKLVVGLSQRAKHRLVLDYIQEEFGGMVSEVGSPTRVAKAWAVQAKWQLQDKPSQERFLTAIQPYVIVKAEPVRIGLEFIRTFCAPTPMRDALGRIQGKSLSLEEIEHRERLRLALHDANELGPPRVKPSTLPPLDLRHRDRTGEAILSDTTTVSRGEHRYNARLTEENVRELRAVYAAGGVTQQALADRYGVSLMAINKVLNGKAWAHVT